MRALALIPLPGNESVAAELAPMLEAEVLLPLVRRFPDGESHVRIDADLHGRATALVCSLDRPDDKFLQLLFAAATATDLGAGSVGLIVPYLPYMRQDGRFQRGEAISAKLFASFLSPHIDWLVTVDPHLHRIHALTEVYRVRSIVLRASEQIAQFVAEQVPDPLIVGPDRESAELATAVAQLLRAPLETFAKQRTGDRNVVATASENLGNWRDRTPVIVDDIISSGSTMIEALGVLSAAGMRPPVCIGVHAIFSGDAYGVLERAGAARILTTNTIAHPSNAIDIVPLLASGVKTAIA